MVFVLCCSFVAKPHWDISTKKGQEEWEKVQKEKIYISSDQIKITPEGMYVLFNGEPFQVAEILQDENGIYVRHLGFYWRCKNGHPNPPWNLVCWVCGST